LAAVGTVIDVHRLDFLALAQIHLPPVRAGNKEAPWVIRVSARSRAPVPVRIAVDGAVRLSAPSYCRRGHCAASTDAVDAFHAAAASVGGIE